MGSVKFNFLRVYFLTNKRQSSNNDKTHTNAKYFTENLKLPPHNALILLYYPAKQVPAAQRWTESKSLTLDLKKINTK